MLGAIVGDIVGSIYEKNPVKTKDFDFFAQGCTFTGASVMTIAVADAVLSNAKENSDFKSIVVEKMQEWGRKYQCAGYSEKLLLWVESENPQPYDSFDIGAAMRVSDCGLRAYELNEAIELAKQSAEVTHNHPEGIRGAQATAAAIFLAKDIKNKAEIKRYIAENFYPLDLTLDEIRPNYYFDKTCQESVPQAIQAFLESQNFEEAIRNAIYLGGDGKLAAITGSIAEAYYGIPMDIQIKAMSYLTGDLKNFVIEVYPNLSDKLAVTEENITFINCRSLYGNKEWEINLNNNRVILKEKRYISIDFELTDIQSRKIRAAFVKAFHPNEPFTEYGATIIGMPECFVDFKLKSGEHISRRYYQTEKWENFKKRVFGILSIPENNDKYFSYHKINADQQETSQKLPNSKRKKGKISFMFRKSK